MRRAFGPALIALALLPALAQAPLLDQGRSALRRGDAETAIALLEKAVTQAPRSAEAHYLLASAYGAKVMSSGMLAAARYGPKMKEAYENAVALDPRHVDARFGLVQFYAMAPGMMGGSTEKALDQARQIKAVDPILGHRAYSFVYSQQKKPELARKEYLDAVREAPTSPKAHSLFGQYLGNVEKDFKAAFEQFETALKLDPAYMPALYHLGRTAGQSGTNLPRGEEALKRYLAYTPEDGEPSLAAAHYHLGVVYEKAGKRAEARQSYGAALELNPSLKEAAAGLKRLS